MEHKAHQQVPDGPIRKARRQGVDLSRITAIRSRQVQPDQPLPLVLEPEAVDVDLVDWAATHRDFVEASMLTHGAVLFRGFAVASATAFERVVSAVYAKPFDEYGDLPREPIGEKVYSSTPYPADETILFHNEGSHQHRWPMHISFFCVKAAQRGGESPIVDCRRMYQALDPAIRDRFERLGLTYVRNFTEGLDVSWEQFFHTSDRAEVEAYCRTGRSSASGRPITGCERGSGAPRSSRIRKPEKRSSSTRSSSTTPRVCRPPCASRCCRW